MTKKIKVILTCFKQTSYEDYTHFFKTVEKDLIIGLTFLIIIGVV